MSDSSRLERRYRRLLACYPRAFRREHEQEMLAVLMDGADKGQQRPRLAEATDLIKNATWMRLRPTVPRSQPMVFWAVCLIYVCAALRLSGVPLLPGSSGHPLAIGIGWGVFALLAWATGRGHNWARLLFVVWFGLHTLALFYDIAQGSASSAPAWALIATVVFWLVELSAVLLILSKQSGAYYRHKPAQT